MKIIVRIGRKADATSAINVLRSSISELCSADHNNDARAIKDWISNKTEETWVAWLDREDAAVFVAENSDDIVGVGMVDQRGEILLNYVRPDARFSGISKAILRALEDFARGKRIQRCFLQSTKTAKTFYESCGYSTFDDASLNLEKKL